MSKHGYELGVDLAKVLAMGRVQVPHMAYTYVTANRLAGGTGTSDNAMFVDGAPADRNGGYLAEVASEWTALRDVLQGVLGDTAESLESAAKTLLYIAGAYADTDGEVDRAMRSAYASNEYGAKPGDPEIHSYLDIEKPK